MCKKYITLFALLGLVIVSGCSKQAALNTYTFVNQTDRLVNIFIYRTQADYIEGHYPAVSGTIHPHSNYDVPVDVISDNHNYYVEYYSDDFVYNNWGDTSLQTKITPSDKGTFYITSNQKNNLRKLCLSGNAPLTTWAAVDAFAVTDLNTSIWLQIPDTERVLNVTITRRYNGNYDYLPHHGIHDTIAYSIQQDAAGMHLLFSGASQVVMTSTSQPSVTNPSSIDSAWIETNGRRYIMVKQ